MEWWSRGIDGIGKEEAGFSAQVESQEVRGKPGSVSTEASRYRGREVITSSVYVYALDDIRSKIISCE